MKQLCDSCQVPLRQGFPQNNGKLFCALAMVKDIRGVPHVVEGICKNLLPREKKTRH